MLLEIDHNALEPSANSRSNKMLDPLTFSLFDKYALKSWCNQPNKKIYTQNKLKTRQEVNILTPG